MTETKESKETKFKGYFKIVSKFLSKKSYYLTNEI